MENSSYMIRSVAIDITNKCNFRCLHCYNYSGEHNRESEMSDQEILNIINEICDYQPDSNMFMRRRTTFKSWTDL